MNIKKEIIKNALLTSGVFLAPVILLSQGKTIPNPWMYISMYLILNMILSGISLGFHFYRKKKNL